MTDGLAILGAWIELGAIVGLLAWRLLRHAESDPIAEAARDLMDRDDSSA